MGTADSGLEEGREWSEIYRFKRDLVGSFHRTWGLSECGESAEEGGENGCFLHYVGCQALC